MAGGGDLLLRTHGGLSVLARAFPCRLRLRVPARRRGAASPLAAAKVDIADVVSRIRSGSAGDAVDQKKRRRHAEEGLSFARVVTSRGRGVDEKGVEGEAPELEKSGDEAGGVDGSYLSETRFD